MTSAASPCLFLTGGSGFLGRHVVAAATRRGWTTVAPGSREVDLRDAAAVVAVIDRSGADAVIHTAYRKTREDIVAATRHVAAACAQSGRRLVAVSTDALFAGRPRPYTEADEPDPVHEYGRWKLDAERVVASLADAVVVRTSLLYSRSARSPHDDAVHDALAGTRPLTFFTDEYRSALFADDLADVLLDLSLDDAIRGVLHVAGPRALSRAELARASCVRHGWDPGGVRTGTLAESGLDRPARVELDSSLAATHGWTVDGPAPS